MPIWSKTEVSDSLRGKGKITYKQYPETFEGLIQSHIDRDPLFNTDFYQQWKSQAETMKAV